MTAQPIELVPGMRVRCVNAGGSGDQIERGKTYSVIATKQHPIGDLHIQINPNHDWELWRANRFKPVIRVKAPCVPSFDILLRRAVAAFNAMSTGEKAAHVAAQRESWSRQDMD